MKLNSKSLILAVLLSLGAAVESFASSVFAYGCYQTPNNGPIACSFGQYPTAADAEADDMLYTFPTWVELVNALKLDALVAIDGEANGMIFYLKTDMDMGGFAITNGDTACANEFQTIDFSAFGENLREFDGGNHTIRNFCKIATDESVGFFDNVPAAKVMNVAFDSVYVKSITSGTIMSDVGVFAVNAVDVSFDGVSVTNAYVQAPRYAGGVVGNYIAQNESIQFENISVKAVMRAPFIGGVIGKALYNISGAISDGSILNSSVDLDAGFDNSDDFKVGGLIGYLTVAGRNTFFTGNTVSVVVNENAENNSISFGGLVGEVICNNESPEVWNIHNDIDVSLKTSRKDVYAGGIAGRASFLSTLVVDTLNTVHAVFSSNGSVNGTVAAGGVFGQLSDVGKMRIVKATIDARLVAAGNWNQRLGGVVGSAQLVALGDLLMVNNDVKASIVSSGTENVNVAMGGMLAYAEEEQLNGTYQGMTINCDTNNVLVTMEAASQKEIYAGGVAGYMNVAIGISSEPVGGLFASVTTVKPVDGKDIIKVSSEGVEHLYAGGVLGKVFALYGRNEIRRTRVDGDINITTGAFTDSSAVGGLVGEMYSQAAFIYDNVSVGNILANAPSMGFCVGKYISARKDVDGFELYTSLHYGEKDGNVPLAAGSLWKLEIEGATGDSTFTLVENWDKDKQNLNDYIYNVKFVYRNSVEAGNVLEPTGELNLEGNGTIKVGDEFVYSGTVDESAMKSRLMTYVLGRKAGLRMYDILDSAAPKGFVYWESERDSIPHICRKGEDLTVYRAKVSIDDVASSLTDEDKLSLEGILDSIPDGGGYLYSFITYTENNKRVNEDFLKRVRALNLDYGFVNGSAGLDLETHVFSDDIDFTFTKNKEFVVAYEIKELQNGIPTGKYLDLDEALVYPVYLWPKVTKTSLYNNRAVVPPVFVESGNNTKQEYYLQEVYVNCKEGASPCSPISPFSPSQTPTSFSMIMPFVSAYYGDEHSDTLHLVYGASSFGNDVTPEMTFAGDRNKMAVLTGYGYKDGEVDALDTMSVGDGGYTMQLMASRYSAAGTAGFVMKKWEVDFWAYTSISASDIEDCYSGESVSEGCTPTKTMDFSENYLANAGLIMNILAERDTEDLKLKWHGEFNPEDELIMDSVLSAIVNIPLRTYEYSYHMHISPVLEVIPYTITFNVNADYPVFVSGYTDTLVVYSRENELTTILPMLHTASEDYCFDGWKTVANGSGHSSFELDEDMLKEAALTNNEFNLYGNWIVAKGEGGIILGECQALKLQQVSLQYQGEIGSEGGKVYLWQRLVNPNDTLVLRHDFDDSVVNLPIYSDAPFWFHIGAEPKQDYALSEMMLVYEDAGKFDTLHFDVQDKDPLVEIHADGRKYTLYATFDKYIDVTFDLNTDQDGIFYDEAFNLEAPLTIIRGGGQVDLPAWIYTKDSCVLGWAFDSDADSAIYQAMTYMDRLYNEAPETKKLYAVWGDAEKCVDRASYIRVSAEAEHGEIKLLEEGDTETRLHGFGSDGHLILPLQAVGPMRVKAVPDDGYELDYIELVQNGRTEPVTNGDWVDLYEDGARLIAYFVDSSELEEDTTEVAEPVLEKSGNAIRFRFDGLGFPKGDDSWVHILLENVKGDTLADTLFNCFDEYCNIGWHRYSLSAGYYLFTAIMNDGVNKETFERDFEIRGDIAIAGGNTWQMISLASVDLDELAWDGDEVFYWWAEEWNYGKYWQYQEFKKGQTPEPERGYWYSSIEGRPLMLKDEPYYVESVTWNLKNVNSGWNLMANPYGWYIDLGVPEPIDEEELREKIRNHGEDVDEEEIQKMLTPTVEFWCWNGEAGEPEPCDGSLKPYEAVWVKLNNEESMEWEISAEPSYFEIVDVHGDALLKKSLNRRLAKASWNERWSLRLTLSDGKGKKDSWNTLGAGKFAWKSEEAPAGLGDRVNLSIVEGGKRLAKSVKAETAAAAYEWNVELSATSARNGFLEIAGIADLEARGLAVYVEVDGNRVRMQDGVPLKVALTPASKSARVYVGGTPKVALSKSLEGLRAVRVGAMLQVGFVAGAGLAGSAVRVDVLDLEGNVVRSAGVRTLNGTNQLSFDAPKPGIYMLRVRAGNQMRAGRILVK